MPTERSPTRPSGRAKTPPREPNNTATSSRNADKNTPCNVDKDTASSSSTDNNNVETRYLELMSFINNELDATKRLPKLAMQTLRDKVALWALAQAEIQGQLKSANQEITRLREEVERNKQAKPLISYAAITSKPKLTEKEASIRKSTETKTNTLFILSNKGEDGKKIQETFMRSINPRDTKIRINAMRTTGKALIVETATEVDLQNIMINKKIKEELTCELPRKRNPLVILYDVPANSKGEEIVESIYHQNFDDTLSWEEFNDSFKLKFKTGPRDKPTVHHVAEVSGKMRQMIFSRARLYLGFRAINVKDYLVVPKCMRCQDLGHVSKHCPRTQETCAHCGVEEHTRANCSQKDKPPVCIPCMKKGKKCTKTQKDCPTHKLLLERLIQRTDYGA